jgi:hypothetical protein
MFMAGYTLLHLAWMAVLMVDFISRLLAPDPTFGSVAYRFFLVLVITPLALIVSILVFRRTPGNVTGLCLLLWGVTLLGTSVPVDSPIYLHNIAFNTGWTGLWLLALYFPNGRASPLRFERWIRLLSIVTVTIIAIWIFFQPTMNNFNAADPSEVKIHNPFFVPALQPFKSLVDGLDMIGLVSVILLIIPSLFLRYRASSEKERLQIKWLAWVYGLLVVSLLFFIPSGLLSGDPKRYGVPGLIASGIFGLYVSLAPYIAIGNAILRHRLYDIDLIIRRTLQYSLVTGVLALVFFGGVTILQSIFSAISGEQSSLAIALSTLAIAALFNPLRKRVQEFIDRRFYRQKYNAAKALAEFAAAARNETDLSKLTERLTGTVQETVNPQQVSLWIKKK